ncbi:hypothetical protein GCM10007937_27160 [Mesorhizobium albiziae]|nr:hypothetical protein GCM10007937_27160 [Mesorhizobium albiziae]
MAISGSSEGPTLATVLDAVDLGFPVVVLGDAVASSSEQSHRATLDLLLPRMPQQITVAATAEVLKHLARIGRNRLQSEVSLS